ncbi:unnamed protein product [Ixodes hexagonus]
MLKRNVVSHTFQIADDSRSCITRRECLKPRSRVSIFFRRFLFNPHDDTLEAVQVQGVFFLQDGQALPQAWLVTLNVGLKPSVPRFYRVRCLGITTEHGCMVVPERGWKPWIPSAPGCQSSQEIVLEVIQDR